MGKIHIATIGKTVGLKGELKLNLLTDFASQFKKGKSFNTKFGNLEIEHFHKNRSVIKFVGYDNIDLAKKLTNQKLYTTEEETRNNCNLSKDEFFWFDIIGLNIVDNGIVLGKVTDIERLSTSDYLMIETDKALESMPKRFLLPYIDRYILDVNLEKKEIYTQDAIDILENS